MRKRLTINAAKKLLTEELKLKSPEFDLSVGRDRKINGYIISPTFKGKGDRTRQGMIWDALSYVLGIEGAERQVGIILAFTPLEWNMNELSLPVAKPKRKKAG